MSEVSFYRKYRPHNFANLVGQDHIQTTLINALKNNYVSHAYLFTGSRGTGKTTTARLLAKALNCLNLKDEYEPCNECDFCIEINEGKLIDIIEIDAASNRGIDEVRDLKEKINFAPTRSKYKVYIIDEVHMMTKDAFNALLKTLEEPPAHAYFILATTEPYKIPETIISRCQRFDFKRINQKVLMTRLSFIAQKEGIMAEDKALEAISKYVNGGMRDAIGLLEQLRVDDKLTFEHVSEVLGVSDHTLLDKLFECLIEKNSNEAINIIQILHEQGVDFRQFGQEFIDLLRIKMLFAVQNNEYEEVNKLLFMISIFKEEKEKLDSNIPQLSMEIAIIKICGGKISLGKEDSEKMINEKEEQKSVSEISPSKKEEIPESKKEKKENLSKDEEENEKYELNFDTLKEKWPRIMERLISPTLKRSLKNVNLKNLEENELFLEFSSKFHKEKVLETENRAELELLIKKLFDQQVKITANVNPLDIKPVKEKKGDNVEDALDIFGGEIVEEEEKN